VEQNQPYELRPLLHRLNTAVRGGRELAGWVLGKTWPILLGVLSPALFVIRTGIRYWLIFKVFRVTKQRRADPKMLCPACGWGKDHPFKYDATLRAIVHECPLCKANWSSPCFVNAESWDVSTRRPVPRRVQAVAEESENEQVG
jgi:hypothetical protein